VFSLVSDDKFMSSSLEEFESSDEEDDEFNNVGGNGDCCKGRGLISPLHREDDDKMVGMETREVVETVKEAEGLLSESLVTGGKSIPIGKSIGLSLITVMTLPSPVA